MLDPLALAPAPTVALALAKVTPILQRIRKGLRTNDTGVRRGRGSEEFDPLDPAPQHQPANNPSSSHGTPSPLHHVTLGQRPFLRAWSQTIARLGLRWSPALADVGLQR